MVTLCPSHFATRRTLFHVLVGFFLSSRRRHTISTRDWSSDVCSSDLTDGVYRNWIIHPENFLANPHAAELLVELSANYPISVHTVGISVGSAASIDRWHLKRIR